MKLKDLNLNAGGEIFRDFVSFELASPCGRRLSKLAHNINLFCAIPD